MYLVNIRDLRIDSEAAGQELIHAVYVKLDRFTSGNALNRTYQTAVTDTLEQGVALLREDVMELLRAGGLTDCAKYIGIYVRFRKVTNGKFWQEDKMIESATRFPLIP